MTDCERLRIVFAGTPDFAASALQALLDSHHQVTGVLTQPDRPSGRGRKRVGSAVKQLAVSHELPVQQPLSLRDPEALDALFTWRCDVMVVAAYGLILPESVLSWPALGCLNIHASLLPRWRGAAPIQRAILAGDRESGVCIMKMDAGLDTGDVLSRESVPIDSATNGGQLHDTLADLGGSLLLATLPPFCKGDIAPQAQAQNGITYADKLDKAEALLDFTKTTLALHRQIQAFNPWPVAEVPLEGERIRIWRSEVVSSDQASPAPPGTVVDINERAVHVATGDGVIALVELQRPGKKPLPAHAFCLGVGLDNKVFG